MSRFSRLVWAFINNQCQAVCDEANVEPPLPDGNLATCQLLPLSLERLITRVVEWMDLNTLLTWSSCLRKQIIRISLTLQVIHWCCFPSLCVVRNGAVVTTTLDDCHKQYLCISRLRMVNRCCLCFTMTETDQHAPYYSSPDRQYLHTAQHQDYSASVWPHGLCWEIRRQDGEGEITACNQQSFSHITHPHYQSILLCKMILNPFTVKMWLENDQ